MASAQGILWERQTLIRLTIGIPDWRKEPRACVLPSPAAAEPYEPTVAEVCYTLRWLRDWRYWLHQDWLAQGKPANVKRLMEAIDHQANGVADLLGQLWQDKETPRWKKAS